MVRSMLADSGFPSSMCAELFMAAAYLKNRTSRKALRIETPFQMVYVEEADLSHLQGIGAQNLRAQQGLQKARRRGLGREGVRL